MQFIFIGDLAAKLGISPVTIRFYEKVGLVSPRRIGRFRTYQAQDIAKLSSIIEMRSMGFPIALIRDTLTMSQTLEPSAQHTRFEEILSVHLRELQAHAARIDGEIEATCQRLQSIDSESARGIADLFSFKSSAQDIQS